MAPVPIERTLWRIGHRVRLNVYKGDTPMFQCHTPEQATEIVILLNTAESLKHGNLYSQTSIDELHRQIAEEKTALKTVVKYLRDKLENIRRAGNDYCEARAHEALEILERLDGQKPEILRGRDDRI